jgi:Immunity protein 35
MISEAEAFDIAQRFIARMTTSAEGGAVIVAARTIQKPYGWIFFYNSRRYLETSDPLEALAGNGPIVVDRETGELHALGSSSDAPESIAAFEKAAGLYGEPGSDRVNSKT